MNKLFSMFFDVCRLRAAPQDLPTSRSLLVATLLLYALLSIVISVVQMSLVKALLAAFMDTALLAGLSFFLLWARMLANRWVQTCIALAGSGTVLELVALPLMIWQKQFGPESSLVIVPTLFLLVVLFWNLVVVGHILRHALSTSLVMGSVLATVYMYVSLSIIKILFFSGI